MEPGKKHECSRSVKNWSRGCLVAGIILVILAVVAWAADGPGGELLTAGLAAIACRPLLRSLSILVRHAEVSL